MGYARRVGFGDDGPAWYPPGDPGAVLTDPVTGEQTRVVIDPFGLAVPIGIVPPPVLQVSPDGGPPTTPVPVVPVVPVVQSVVPPVPVVVIDDTGAPPAGGVPGSPNQPGVTPGAEDPNLTAGLAPSLGVLGVGLVVLWAIGHNRKRRP